MSRPGARLRATLARHCDEKIMRQCIDPIIADLQAEYRSARNEGRVWHSRRIRLAGYASVLEVAVMCVWRGSLSAITEWPAVDLQALRRTVGWFGLVTLAGTLVILTPEYWKYAAVERFPVASLLYLMPYALSIALPLGLMVGIGAGLGRGPRSPRIAVSVIVIAIACSIGAFVNLAWMNPVGNHAFRTTLFASWGGTGVVPKGNTELTLSELRQRYSSSKDDGSSRHTTMGLTYYRRWALAFAPLPLALFGLSLRVRSGVRRLIFHVAALLVFFVCVDLTGQLARVGVFSAMAAAWLPNALIAVAATRNFTRRPFLTGA